ncbi:MAG: ABC transporter substrate-binding protein, partial [Peptostreptococcaceae bacterium]|nr:ABC transporter substrate-binding protein [Peptostreptococcaceae bacterium]
LLLSTLMILGLTACSSKNENNINGESNNETSLDSDSHYPVTITTYNYKNEPVDITFDKAPEKVVAVYQNSIETLLALGLEDKIEIAAGLDHEVKDEYKDAFSKVNYIEEFTPSKETVVMEQPDFILSWYSLFSDKNLGDVDYWHQNNINTYMALNSGAAQDRTLENEKADILNLGKIFNVEDKANQIVNEIDTKTNEVENSVKDQEKQTTLIIEYMDGQIYTYGAKTLGGDMVQKLGAELLNPNGGNISEEDLIKLNPDSIFVVYMDRTDEDMSKEAINTVMNNKALSSLNAIKNERVNSIALGEMYCSGIRTIDGINTFANGLYPNLNK